MSGVSALTRQAPGGFLALFIMRGLSDKAAGYEPGRGFSPEYDHAGTMILAFLFPELRSTFLPFCSICYSSLNGLRQLFITEDLVTGLLTEALPLCSSLYKVGWEPRQGALGS